MLLSLYTHKARYPALPKAKLKKILGDFWSSNKWSARETSYDRLKIMVPTDFAQLFDFFDVIAFIEERLFITGVNCY